MKTSCFGSHIIDRTPTAVFWFRGGPPPLVGHCVVVVILMEVFLLLMLCMLIRRLLTRQTSNTVYAVTWWRTIQRRRADTICRAWRCSVFAPLDGMRVVLGTASPQCEVPLTCHLVLFLPLYPTVSIYWVHRTPVPRRFDGAQEFLWRTKAVASKTSWHNSTITKQNRSTHCSSSEPSTYLRKVVIDLSGYLPHGYADNHRPHEQVNDPTDHVQPHGIVRAIIRLS